MLFYLFTCCITCYHTTSLCGPSTVYHWKLGYKFNDKLLAYNCDPVPLSKNRIANQNKAVREERLLHLEDDLSSGENDIDLSSLCLLLIALAELGNEDVQ